MLSLSLLVSLTLATNTLAASIVSPYNPHSQYYASWPKPIDGIAREACSASCPNGTVTEYHCCPLTCKQCGVCTGDWNTDMECCWSTIQSNAYLFPDQMICGPGVTPPCIVNATRYDCDLPKEETQIPEWAKWENWSFPILVGVLVVLGLIAILIVYACCCFGHRLPPAPYDEIKNHKFKPE